MEDTENALVLIGSLTLYSKEWYTVVDLGENGPEQGNRTMARGDNVHNSDRGSGYVEYIVVIGLVALALVAATRFYHNQIEMVFIRSADEFAATRALISE